MGLPSQQAGLQVQRIPNVQTHPYLLSSGQTKARVLTLFSAHRHILTSGPFYFILRRLNCRGSTVFPSQSRIILRKAANVRFRV